MPFVTSYTDARQNFAELLDKAVNDREVIIITRRGSQAVALIAADELASLMETAHLLRSPKNAERLLAAMEEAKRGEGIKMTVEELRKHVGLEGEKVIEGGNDEDEGKSHTPHGKKSQRKARAARR